MLELFHRRSPCGHYPELPFTFEGNCENSVQKRTSPLVILVFGSHAKGLPKSATGYLSTLAPDVGLNCEKQLVKTGWPFLLSRMHAC